MAVCDQPKQRLISPHKIITTMNEPLTSLFYWYHAIRQFTVDLPAGVSWCWREMKSLTIKKVPWVICMHAQSMNHISMQSHSHCTGCVLANTRPYQGDWECYKAQACWTHCSVCAGSGYIPGITVCCGVWSKRLVVDSHCSYPQDWPMHLHMCSWRTAKRVCITINLSFSLHRPVHTYSCSSPHYNSLLWIGNTQQRSTGMTLCMTNGLWNSHTQCLSIA